VQLLIDNVALATGIWTNGGRLFEVIFAVWWWLGIFGRMGPLDFLARNDTALSSGYLVLTAGLLVLAMAGRERQIRGTTS
jgi:hypothetical protein